MAYDESISLMVKISALALAAVEAFDHGYACVNGNK